MFRLNENTCLIVSIFYPLLISSKTFVENEHGLYLIISDFFDKTTNSQLFAER